MSDRQRKLFDPQPEPWEADDQAEQLVASVVLSSGPEQAFDYLVPPALAGQVEPGRRVRVPLGRANRPLLGYCVAVASRPAGLRQLKPLLDLVDNRRLLSPAMLRLTKWIAEHYLCSWGQVLETVVPAAVRSQAGTRLVTLLSLDPAAAAHLAAADLPLKQLAVLKALAAEQKPLGPADLARVAGCTLAPITALRRKGLLRAATARVASREHGPAPGSAEQHLVLNADQAKALDVILAALRGRRHETILLHGVTGSGKTEIYIQAIQEVIRYGRQAIVLVPEISLTPQTVERFRLRFGAVAVLHSHLSDAERHHYWQQIAEGAVPVVVGARSAIFAPTPQLGLIVLDEEHETSFKQETAPRYHARDVALARAAAEKVPLVLGSATPSLESWQRARSGRYRLVELPRRVLGRPLPAVGIVDLRCDAGRAATGAISRQLHRAITEALDEGGQVMLLLNRRGFSTHIQCPACGNVMRCPDCDIALTHHRTGETALCHYCDYQVAAPVECPKCQFRGIRYSGRGTQRLEAEVQARFPGVACQRMDADSMRRHGSHHKALGDFRAGKTRILLGTQMIAKGLDFPNVTLVGVILADTALHLPDFRAAERTFHLLTQAAGRTGRGAKGGHVLVQTFNPDHPAIRAAVRQDFAAFAAFELPIREAFHYPPFASMLRLVIRGPVEEEASQFALRLGQRLSAALEEQDAKARVLGPAPAPFPRLRGKYRFQIQIQGPDGDKLSAAVRQASEHLPAPGEVQWIADVDPLDML
jgi:primosomal protein N' (replication factor Y) (superfamily II helicase)